VTNGGLISLFCGPGGFDSGFRSAGFLTQLAYDNDLASVRTHKRNHPLSKTLLADISSLEVNSIVKEWRNVSKLAPVGIIGGSPCQSFSIGNVHQKAADPRDSLPGHFARIIEGLTKHFEIDFIVFENVPGLTFKKHQHVLRRLESRLHKVGFNLFSGTLDAQDFGVAQRRVRLFVVGINRKRYPELQFEFPTSRSKLRTVADAFRGLPEPVYSERGKKNRKIPFHPNHLCMRPLAERFTNGSLTLADGNARSFRALTWNKPSYTVAYGNREVHLHPNLHRRLSVLEAMLLQGFPRKYVLEGTLSDQIRLVSEAVSPPVARALARAISRQTANHRKSTKRGTVPRKQRTSLAQRKSR
jgi:DNA (cytosine-5)-methyltransferase 1